MRRSSGLLAILLLALPLSGCIGGDDPEPTDTEAVPEPTPEEIARAVEQLRAGEAGEQLAEDDPGAQPEWTHGDWCTFDIVLDAGFGELVNGESKVVLHDTQGTYKLAAADRNAAVVDQYFDFPFLGELTKDLNPTMFEEQLTMFQWPMEEGATWTTTVSFFEGPQDLAMVVTEVPDAGDPLTSSPGYLVRGESTDGTILEFTYSPAAKWITRFTLDTPAGFGSDEVLRVFDVTLKDYGSSYEGSFHLIEMDFLYFGGYCPICLVFADTENFPLPPVETVNVPDGYTFVQRFVGVFTFAAPLGEGGQTAPAQAVQEIDMIDPSNGRHEYRHVGDGQSFWFEHDEPALAGDWQVAYAGAGTEFSFVGFAGFRETIVEFTAASHEFHQP